MKVSLGLILSALFLLPVSSVAQSAQPFSFPASALGSVPFGGGLQAVTSGPGWEAQLRWNAGALSFGAGIEQTFHDVDNTLNRTVKLTGGFLEPRYVIDTGSDKAVPYLSGRFAVSPRSSWRRVRRTARPPATLSTGAEGCLSASGPR